jgi:tetratricopeptide (TPR) repeat protein
VSQVKKDILNGWKEIAAYVCRDRRTVERWEKQRGLPVRRMPGAGRATVYALISELDEWLASSKPDELEIENAEDGLARNGASGNGANMDGAREHIAEERQSGASSVSLVQDLTDHFEAGTETFGTNGSGSTEDVAPEASGGIGGIPDTVAAAQPGASVMKPPARWGWVATWATVLGLCFVLVLVVPAVRGRLHFGRGAKGAASSTEVNSGLREKPNSNTGERPDAGANSELHEHSRVAGVDDIYLEGVYSLEQRTPESLERAEQDFSSAIAKDGNYAPAYAGLADTYVLLREYYVMPDEEAFTKAKTAAEHAAALDPRLCEAHATLGFIDFFWLWDRANAEREFRTALEDNPSSAHAHHWYGSMLTHEGKYQAAMEQLNIAQRLEPTSAAILSTRALAMGLGGHRGEAIGLLESLINESPGVSSPHAILAIVSRVEPADFGRYLDEMRRAAELRHSDEMLQVAAAAEPALRSGGQRAMWTAILATEEKLHPGSANRTFLMADAETGLGRDDAAFADLNQLAQRHDVNVMGVVMDPTLAPLRRDRRFGQLLGSLGLTAGER